MQIWTGMTRILIFKREENLFKPSFELLAMKPVAQLGILWQQVCVTVDLGVNWNIFLKERKQCLSLSVHGAAALWFEITSTTMMMMMMMMTTVVVVIAVHF